MNNFESHTQKYLRERKFRDKVEAKLGEEHWEDDSFWKYFSVTALSILAVIGVIVFTRLLIYEKLWSI